MWDADGVAGERGDGGVDGVVSAGRSRGAVVVIVIGGSGVVDVARVGWVVVLLLVMVLVLEVGWVDVGSGEE